MTIKNGVPSGHNTITAHIVCKNAGGLIDFCNRAFGAEETYRLAGPNGKVAHAHLRFGDSALWIADENEMEGVKAAAGPGAVTIHLFVADADALFERAVGAGATVTLPLSDVFWGARYGQLTDPYGTKWSIATQKREVTPEEMKDAMASAASCGLTTAQCIEQEVVVDAAPARVYAALTDGRRFSAMSGGAPAEVEDKVGSPFSVFGGMIHGRNVELVADERVVQAWRVKLWEPGVYSTARFELVPEGKSTRVKLRHSGFPQGEGAHLASGWVSNYWEPLRKYLAS